jgi:hypothetical protein
MDNSKIKKLKLSNYDWDYQEEGEITCEDFNDQKTEEVIIHGFKPH